MLGAVGGFSGWLWTAGVTAPAAILFAGAVAIVAAAYVAASRQDIDGTTEVAALVVLAAGVIAGMGSIRLASGIIALVTLLLVEKSRLHALVQRIDDVGLRSGVRFAVMALVVLPLLPEGPYGPLGGIRPRELWALVLFFSGLSFAGYLARRLVGPGPWLSGHGAARRPGVVDERHVHVRAHEPDRRWRWIARSRSAPWPPTRCSIRECSSPRRSSIPRS